MCYGHLKVKTSPDFKFVNIYWSTSEKANEVKIEEILKESAYALRHELAQLKVIGMVPALNFVKGRWFARFCYGSIMFKLKENCPTLISRWFVQWMMKPGYGGRFFCSLDVLII